MLEKQPKLFTQMSESEAMEAEVQAILDSDRPDKFEVKLELKLKAGNLTHAVPILWGILPGERIEDILQKQINARWFKERLRAIVGEPATTRYL